MNSGGDVLARGGHSAQFSAGGSTLNDFEADFVFKEVAEVMSKYALSQAEYDMYAAQREKGEELPDINPVALTEEMDVDFSVTDRRFASNPKPVVDLKPKKFPDSEFSQMETLLDRILVMVISDDPNIELLEDGSARDKRNGLISTAKYRQQSNVGIVLLAGQWVVMGGVKTLMSSILKPGDKVLYGDYGSEKVPMSDEKAEALCDSICVNYEKTSQGMRVVRVQDVRTIERRKVLCADRTGGDK